MTTFIHADEIRAATFVRTVEVHEALGSTNDRAAELARESATLLPALVVARHQTAGRGRGTNTWQSADGALTFSLLIDPAQFGISTAKWPQVSLATAVAVCDALASHVGWTPPTTADTLPNKEKMVGGAHPTRSEAARLAIKWPNDVMLDGAKVAGILIESPGGAAPAKNRLIVGIGVNVNNSWRLVPQTAEVNGIALCDATSKALFLDAILIRLLQATRERVDQLASNAPQLPAAWQRLCWLTGKRIEVQSNAYSMAGICRGIDTDGLLLVENAGDIQRICSGSVRVK